jgi:hypothetical protein
MKEKTDDELTYNVIGCAMKVHNTLQWISGNHLSEMFDNRVR